MRSGSSAWSACVLRFGGHGRGVQEIPSQPVEGRVHVPGIGGGMAVHLHLHLRLLGKDRPRVLLVERALFELHA